MTPSRTGSGLQAENTLVEDPDREGHQGERVHESGQDPGALIAVGLVLVGGPRLQNEPEPSQ